MCINNFNGYIELISKKKEEEEENKYVIPISLGRFRMKRFESKFVYLLWVNKLDIGYYIIYH